MNLGHFPNLIVCFVRCAPMLIMYMIDTQIWFMLWTAGYGTVLGWTMRIGEAPTFTTVRERFLSASRHFNRKILSDAVPLVSEVEPEYSVPSFSAVSWAGRGVEMRGKANKDGKNKAAVTELQQGLLGVSSTLGNESLRFFAEAWNGVLDDMRQSDMINNHELQLLVFNKWQGAGFSRCTYLPVFITAGKLNEAIHQAAVIGSEGGATSFNLGLEARLHAALGKDFAMREVMHSVALQPRSISHSSGACPVPPLVACVRTRPLARHAATRRTTTTPRRASSSGSSPSGCSPRCSASGTRARSRASSPTCSHTCRRAARSTSS